MKRKYSYSKRPAYALLGLLLGFFLFTAPVQGQPPTRPAPNLPRTQPTPSTTLDPLTPPVTRDPLRPPPNDEGFIINFNNVNIIEYIRFISKISGKNFVFDETDLNFNVTIISDEPTSIRNIMMALLNVLRIHSLSMMEQGNNIIIHKNGTVPMGPNVVPNGAQTDSEIITQIFALKNVSTESILSILQDMTSPQARLEVIEETQHIVLTDFLTNVRKIAELVKAIDAPSDSVSIGRYFLTSNIPMTVLINIAEQVLTPIAGGKAINLIPHVASNSIFIIASPYFVERSIGILKLLENRTGTTRIYSLNDLDYASFEAELQEEERKRASERARQIASGKTLQEIESDEVIQKQKQLLTELESQRLIEELPSTNIAQVSFGVIKLQYRKGNNLQAALQSLSSRLQDAQNINPDIIAAIDSIQWIADSNIIVFTGTKEATKRVRQLIDELDIPVRQIFLEMLILDTTVDNAINFGVEWGFRVNSPNVAAGGALHDAGSPLPVALNNVLASVAPVANTLVTPSGFHLGIIGKVITHNGQGFTTLGALVTALNDDVQTDVILNPKIIAEDNVPAEIFVGLNVRFKGQSIANDQGNIVTTNFEFRDVGDRLRVTPFVNRGDLITLEIEQESSAVLASQSNLVATAVELDAGPITSKSNTITRVHVPSGYFVVLSGMIHDEVRKSTRRIPCLGGLPLVGALFGNWEKIVQKRNRMLFIRPIILSNADDLEDVTKRNQDIWRDKHIRPEMFNFEVESGLDFLQLKRVCNE